MMKNLLFSYEWDFLLDLGVRGQIKVKTQAGQATSGQVKAGQAIEMAGLVDQFIFIWKNLPVDSQKAWKDRIQIYCEVLTRYLFACSIRSILQVPLYEVEVSISKVTSRAADAKAVESYSFSCLTSDFRKDVLGHEKTPWGEVDVIFESRQVGGLYLLHIAPLEKIALHYHKVLFEVEMTLSNGLMINGISEPRGVWHQWGNSSHEYQNPSSDSYKTILCMDCPPFDPGDEIEVGPHVQTIESQGSAVRGGALGIWAHYPARFEFPGVYSDGIFSDQRIVFKSGETCNENPDSVVVFAFDSEKRLLLVHHSSRGWELPGGKIEKGESPEQAAIREVKEEAGADIRELTVLGQYEISARSMDQKFHRIHRKRVFFARYQDLKSFEHQDTDSVRRVLPPSPDEVRWGEGSLTYSPLVQDNVYPLGLRFALAQLERSFKCT